MLLLLENERNIAQSPFPSLILSSFHSKKQEIFKGKISLTNVCVCVWQGRWWEKKDESETETVPIFPSDWNSSSSSATAEILCY